VRGLTEIAAGVFVRTSERYVTNSIVIAADQGRCLLVDPAVTVQDLDELVADLARLSLRPIAGFSTHPHWDHILWSAALGGDVPRFASRRAVEIAEREHSGLIEGVRDSAPGHDLELFGRLRPLDPAGDSVPWDGPEARVVTHEGHAPGHSALFLPDSGVLLAGDMCSDIEIPLLDLDQPDPVGDYRTGLDRLAAIPVRSVVPGHGAVGDATEFRRRIGADVAYLDDLRQGNEPADPRLTADWLAAEHARQILKLRS